MFKGTLMFLIIFNSKTNPLKLCYIQEKFWTTTPSISYVFKPDDS